MRLISRKLLILASLIVVTACGGNGGGEPGGGSDPADPNPVDNQGGATSLINSIRFSWPAEFSVIDGEDLITFDFDTYEYQRGRVIANSNETIRCFDGFEVAPDSLDVDTVNAQIVSSYDGQIISVNNVNTSGVGGQEVILSDIFDSNAEVTTIGRHYYINSGRLNASPGDAAVFYLRCSTVTSDYSQNEVVMRSILDSVQFISSP